MIVERDVALIEMRDKRVAENPCLLDGMIFDANIDDPDVPEHRMRWDGRLRVPHPDIMVVENAMPFLSGLAQVVKEFPDNRWNRSGTIDGMGDGATSDYRTSDWIGLIPLDESALGRYARLISSFEAKFSAFYRDHINPFADVEYSAGWELLRYRVDDEFKEHIDTATYRPTWSHVSIGSELGILTQRRLSIVAFCNDDFAGGLLVFRRQRLVLNPGRGDIPPEFADYTKLDMPPGSLVVWPSCLPFAHIATPVCALPGQNPDDVQRIAAVTWLY